MAEPDGGFIALHRKVREHPYWNDPERFRAWVDLLFMASWKDQRKLVGVEQVELKRGELIASEPWLAGRWDWSRGKVRRFLKAAEKAGEIRPLERTGDGTRYLVVKYDTYQLARPSNETASETGNGQAADTIEEGSKKGEAEKERIDRLFEDEFWPRYPKRAGNRGKKQAAASWRARCRDGINPEAMLKAADRYASYCEATDRINTPYTMMASTFLNDPDNFDNMWKPPAPEQSKGKPQSTGRYIPGAA